MEKINNEDDPIAYSVLSNFEWNLDTIYEVMLAISQEEDPGTVAREWVDNNQEMVDEWTAEAGEIATENSSSE